MEASQRHGFAARPEGRAPGRASFASSGAAVRMNLFAVVLTAFWTPLNTLLLPGMVRPLAPEALRGSALGLVTLLGVGIAVVAQPLFGAASDRWRSPERRRLPMVVAAVLAAPLLVAMWFAPALWLLLAAYIVLQCSMNMAQAAFQALIPDLVPEEERSRPSGIKTALDVGGNAIGLGLAGGLIILGAGERTVMWALCGVVLGGAVIAWLTVPARAQDKRLGPLGGVSGVFQPLLHGPEEFRRAVATRFLFLLGLYPVQRFILLMLEDRYDIEEPLARASAFILIGIVVAAVAGLLAGLLDDVFSSRTMIAGSTALAVAGLIGIAAAPTLAVLAVAGLVLAAGAGAFQAVNWSVLAKSLDDREGARYFGLANIATAGAGALAGAFGPLVDLAQRYVPGATYQVLFGICALIAAAALIPGRHSADYRTSKRNSTSTGTP